MRSILLFALPWFVFLLPREGVTPLPELSTPPAVEAQAADPAPAAPLRWFKGNTHTHTFWSDGNDFPEMVVDWYRRRDYDFLVLSDHNILQKGEKWLTKDRIEKRANQRVIDRYRERFGKSWVQTRQGKKGEEVRLRTLKEFRGHFEKPGEFLLVSGEEITSRFRNYPVHINAVNLRSLVKPHNGKSVREVMRATLRSVAAAEKKSGRPVITHLNHPNFGWGVTAEDLAHVTEERFFEVFNGHPSVHQEGDATHASIERMWDIANTIRLGELKARPLFGMGTDDSHHYHGKGKSSSGKAWVMVRSRSLEADALMKALRAGDFYASTGVTLAKNDFDRSSGTLSLEIAPEQGLSYRTLFIGTRKDYVKKSEPVVNENGAKLRVTRRYDPSVGAVLAEVKGLKASYRLKGDELFVRAVVISDGKPDNPTYKGQTKRAWTQPVGWRKRLRR